MTARETCLTAVVEIAPTQLSERSAPQTGAPRDAWSAWWTACLADAGLLGIVPVAPGSWHVEVDRLRDDVVLARLFEAHLQRLDAESIETIAHDRSDGVVDAFEELLGPLYGGLALRTQDAIVLEPGCCADLGDLAAWDAIIATRPAEWTDLWTGHPHPRVRVDGERLVLSDAVCPAQTPAPEPRHVLDLSRVVEDLARARRDLVAFAERMTPVVQRRLDLRPDLASTIARHLAGQRL